MRLRRLGRFGALGLGGLSGAMALFLAGMGGMGSWPGCTIYDPSLLYPAEAGSDAASISHLAKLPGRPPPSSLDAGLNSTLVAAMTSIDLGVGPEGGALPPALPPIGWDLDGVDTCNPGQGAPYSPSCQQAPGTRENCDDEAGRDHTGLQIFRTLGPTAQAGVANVNQALQTGLYGLLIEMTGYNSLPDDDQVTVSLYFSSGVLGPGDGGAPTLNHDGRDPWTVDPRSIAGGCQGGAQLGNLNCAHVQECPPCFSDPIAYVSGGVLVAHLGEVPITFGGRANIGGAVMDLRDTTLVGTLSGDGLPGGGTSWWIVNGTISGRWSSERLLSNLATIPDPTSDAGDFLCGSNTNYAVLKDYICKLQDITSTGSDNTMPLTPCDAISMAFGFTAEPAALGVVAPLPPTPQGCTSEGGVAFHDTCN